MLQILSGKFFGDGVRNTAEEQAVLFSNASWVGPIKTTVATLTPTHLRGGTTPYVMSYRNQLEKEQEQPDRPRQAVLVLADSSEAVSQFTLLATFGLEAFFASNESTIAMYCRRDARNVTDDYRPSQYVPRYFDARRHLTYDEVEDFRCFIEKVISLRRSDYIRVIRYLTNLYNALEALNFNVDLAYAMCVYSLEALGQGAGEYVARWEDYDPRARSRIDVALNGSPSTLQGEIRSAILESSHLKLQQRFVEFTVSHLSDEFFTSRAPSSKMAARPSVLRRALRNAYQLRSRYTHALEQLADQIRQPISDFEVFHWQGEPYLSFRGLFRVTTEVIRHFIKSRESVEHEEYPWRDNLPGTITLELAPQYWIWKHEAFDPSESGRRLGGFLENLFSVREGETDALADLRPLLSKYEELLPDVRAIERPAMVTLYILFNSVVWQDGRVPDWESKIAPWRSALEHATTPALVHDLLVTGHLRWTIDECREAIREYQTRRFGKRGLVLPRSLELALLTAVGNRLHADGRHVEHGDWMRDALLEAAGLPEWQQAIRDALTSQQSIDWRQLLPRKQPPQAS